MFSDKTIFISALDWGLGHATRCVPLIRQLNENNRVVIGTTPLTAPVFNEEFPELEKIEVPAYNIRYSRIVPIGIKLALDSPRILSVIRSEKKHLEKLVKEKQIDVVISDNRFGLYSAATKNIFITHQVFLKSPFANSTAQRLNQHFLLKFDELWIPDYENGFDNLSGDLSHGKHFHPNVKYIGPLSRLQKISGQKKYDYLLLLSGPEPHHSILRKKLIEQARISRGNKFALVTNVPQVILTENIDIYCSPSAAILSELIASSETIVCRSGYSTLMDLHLLGKEKLILIPTPGQPEQEYLARIWESQFASKISAQQKISWLIF